MNHSAGISLGTRFLITAAAFVIVVAGMRASASLVVPFLLSAFLAILCASPLGWLQEKGIPSPLALLMVVVSIAVVGLLIGALAATSINDFTRKLPEYQANLAGQERRVHDWLESHDIRVSEHIDQPTFDANRLMAFVGNVLGSLAGVLQNSLLILLTVVFLLLEASGLPKKLRAMPGYTEATRAGMDKIVADIRNYVSIKTWISLLTGVLVATWLRILGVDFPLLWGVLTFFFNFVPNVGSFIAAVPTVLLALVQLGPSSALFTILGYAVINGIIGNVIEPRLMGNRLGLSTLVVFVSLVFWGWVLGPVGMLLSVPLTMIVKIALQRDEGTRWLAILLSSDAALKAEAKSTSAQSTTQSAS